MEYLKKQISFPTCQPFNSAFNIKKRRKTQHETPPELKENAIIIINFYLKTDFFFFHFKGLRIKFITSYSFEYDSCVLMPVAELNKSRRKGLVVKFESSDGFWRKEPAVQG